MKFLRLPFGVCISPTDSSPSSALSSDRQLISMARWDPLDTRRVPLTTWLWEPAAWAWSRSCVPIAGADSRLLLSLSLTSPPPAVVGVPDSVLPWAAGCSLPFDWWSLSRLVEVDASVRQSQCVIKLRKNNGLHTQCPFLCFVTLQPQPHAFYYELVIGSFHLYQILSVLDDGLLEKGML